MEENSAEIDLNETDIAILREVQLDGRISNVELASRVNLSESACLRRVRALEKAGFVKGYHADLDAKALGYNVTVFAHMGLSSQAERDLEAPFHPLELVARIRTQVGHRLPAERLQL